jgi:hypothetical protein
LGKDKYKYVPNKEKAKKVLNDPEFKKEHQKVIDFMKSNKDKGFTLKVASDNKSYEKALRNKAKKTGEDYSKLKEVYKRGLAAWKTGHRPGVSQHQ